MALYRLDAKRSSTSFLINESVASATDKGSSKRKLESLKFVLGFSSFATDLSVLSLSKEKKYRIYSSQRQEQQQTLSLSLHSFIPDQKDREKLRAWKMHSLEDLLSWEPDEIARRFSPSVTALYERVSNTLFDRSRILLEEKPLEREHRFPLCSRTFRGLWCRSVVLLFFPFVLFSTKTRRLSLPY